MDICFKVDRRTIGNVKLSNYISLVGYFDAKCKYSVVTLSYLPYVRDLCRLRSCLDSKTASTITILIVHCKLDYCNYLSNNLPKNLHQQITTFEIYL